MSLLDLGIRVLAILGLGMAPLVDQALPMPGRGELAQGTGTQAREFTLVSALYADGPGPRHLQALRSGLIDAFKPDLVTTEQPLILRYQACDDEGDPLGESMDIICKYRSGLEGNWDNHQQERLALNFKMHLPLIQNTYDNGSVLGYQTTVANFSDIGYRDTDGTWKAMGTGVTGATAVNCLLVDPAGQIYAGGYFTQMGGVANTSRIALWTGSAWSALGTGALNGNVSALAIGPDGAIYAGGEFTQMGGVASTAYIAKWSGGAWSALGTGANNPVRSLVVTSDGSLYAGGEFTLMGGVANTVNIARWDGAVWTPLGAGMNGAVWALAYLNNNLYVGGAFSTAGGIPADFIARWATDSLGWAALGAGADDTVLALAIGKDGSLYAGGEFLTLGEGSINHIGRWNGVRWEQLRPSMYKSLWVGDVLNGTNSDVYTIYPAPNGDIYIGGDFTTAGGVPLPDRGTIWNGSTFLPLDVNVQDAAAFFYAYAIDKLGRLYVGGGWAGTNAISATITTPTIGSGSAYPVIGLTGPGTIRQIKNYTTGKSIFFDLTLLAGETAILNLNPANPSFISSFRGSLWNTILPGSTLNFPLLPGNNNISAYFFGSTTAATAIVMTWRGQYWSLDGAAWK